MADPRPVSPEAAPPRCAICGSVLVRTELGLLTCQNAPCVRFAKTAVDLLAEAAPPRATTPEPMTDARLADIRLAVQWALSEDGTGKIWADVAAELIAELDRLRVPLAPSPSRESGALLDEEIARQFHEAYERLAPSFGHETRKASAKPWDEVPENNRRLMIAVVGEIRASLGRRP